MFLVRGILFEELYSIDDTLGLKKKWLIESSSIIGNFNQNEMKGQV